jgi:hypothetical protein
MNTSDLVSLYHKLFQPHLCNELIEEIKQLHPARWIKRTQLQVGRGVNSLDCSYSCVLNEGFGKQYLSRLQDAAPEIEGARLAEVVVNRYDPGDYIPAHWDRTLYLYNMLINLQTGSDGIVIDDEFYPDEIGRAVIFKGAGTVHSVPQVKETRYTLIYLYERSSYA